MDAPVEFHTPEELLGTAKLLLFSGDDSLNRAVVLEAITALESLIQATVFPLLERSLPQELVSWLEERTRMDFDSRLAVLAPVATGRPVSKTSDLWARYKRAKRIRNEVTHQGRRVSTAEAEEVLATVDAWIRFLSSTVEVSLSLETLKSRLETRTLPIRSEQEAIWQIADFYRSAQGVKFTQQPFRNWERQADLVLDFGQSLVPFEIKFVKDEGQALRVARTAEQQASAFLRMPHVNTAAVILLFLGVEVPEYLNAPYISQDGRVIRIGIRLPAIPE